MAQPVEMRVQDVRPQNYMSRALEASTVPFFATELVGVTIFNTNASGQYIWLFDRSTAPGSGAVGGIPIAAFTAVGSVFVSWGNGEPGTGRRVYSGIVIANSSSATSFAAGSADCWFDVQYRDWLPDA